MERMKLGIALGGGAARGWAHIGVLRALAERGLEPQCIAGASIGALVGAAAATGQLDKLEAWVRALSRLDVLKLLDARFRGGVIQGNRVMAAIEELLSDHRIEALQLRYGAVATDLESGREVWLRDGSMLAAVRASCALPGLFTPSRHDERWLIDGGLVNPVPVSLCYALGADVVIAVNLNTQRVRRLARRKSLFEAWLPNTEAPSMIEVLSGSIRIMQERIARSRLAGEPPQLELCPVIDLELMDFHRAEEAIEAGSEAVRAADKALSALRAAHQL
jgi:NTE family protein